MENIVLCITGEFCFIIFNLLFIIGARRSLAAPEWAVQMEARRVRAEERSAAAFEALAVSANGLVDNLAGIRHELTLMRTLLEARQNSSY